MVNNLTEIGYASYSTAEKILKPILSRPVEAAPIKTLDIYCDRFLELQAQTRPDYFEGSKYFACYKPAKKPERRGLFSIARDTFSEIADFVDNFLSGDFSGF